MAADEYWHGHWHWHAVSNTILYSAIPPIAPYRAIPKGRSWSSALCLCSADELTRLHVPSQRPASRAAHCKSCSCPILSGPPQIPASGLASALRTTRLRTAIPLPPQLKSHPIPLPPNGLQPCSPSPFVYHAKSTANEPTGHGPICCRSPQLTCIPPTGKQIAAPMERLDAANPDPRPLREPQPDGDRLTVVPLSPSMPDSGKQNKANQPLGLPPPGFIWNCCLPIDMNSHPIGWAEALQTLA